MREFVKTWKVFYQDDGTAGWSYVAASNGQPAVRLIFNLILGNAFSEKLMIANFLLVARTN